jgi:hypothetical protein
MGQQPWHMLREGGDAVRGLDDGHRGRGGLRVMQGYAAGAGVRARASRCSFNARLLQPLCFCGADGHQTSE